MAFLIVLVPFSPLKKTTKQNGIRDAFSTADIINASLLVVYLWSTSATDYHILPLSAALTALNAFVHTGLNAHSYKWMGWKSLL